MADTEQDLGGDVEATTPEVLDSGSSSGSSSGSGGSGAATDFPKVEPLNAAEDPANENFLPDPDAQTLPGEEKEES